MPVILSQPYAGALPAWFHAVPAPVYAALPFQPEETPAFTDALLAEEAARHDIVLYTNAAATLRLAGLFPHEQPDTAYFGFWETPDDAASNTAVFAALAVDARRRGRRRLLGPLHFNTFQRYRLRLGAVPSWRQFDREPVNPAYYPALLRRAGLAPVGTFESRLLRPETLPALFADKHRWLAELARVPFEFVPLTPEVWAAHETEIFELVQTVFAANPGYRPVPAAQFRQLYDAQYAARLCPRTSVLLREPASGRLAALSLCHPNYRPLRLPAHQPPDFQRDFPRLTAPTLLAKTVGVHPDFRQRGLMSYLGAYGMVHFQEHYAQALFCLMRTGNHSLHFTDGLPAETAQYALFGREL